MKQFVQCGLVGALALLFLGGCSSNSNPSAEEPTPGGTSGAGSKVGTGGKSGASGIAGSVGTGTAGAGAKVGAGGAAGQGTIVTGRAGNASIIQTGSAGNGSVVVTGRAGNGSGISGNAGRSGSSVNSGGRNSAGAAGGGTVPSETGGTSTGAKVCKDPVYGDVTIPAGNMISDFADGTLKQNVQKGRGEGADPWTSYACGDTKNDATGDVTTPGTANPQASGNKFEVDSTQSGPCGSGGSLHVTSPAKDASVQMSAFWGVGFGIDFMARTAARKKQTYDASAYTGVGFWAKCTKDLPFTYFKVVDGTEDADVVSAKCSYSSTPTCNQYGVKNAAITKDWTYYKLYFNELLQDPKGTSFGKGVDKSKLTAFQIHSNPQSNRASELKENPMDCWIDDVHFLSEPAPTVPTEPVTFTTPAGSNVINRNGAPHRIRGLVRPSMEWDLSGFGVTREDIQRMKAWKANTIRLAVSDTFWTGTSSAIYQANVKRAISWILEEGMDAILDLHYVAGEPNSTHAAFWDAISKDSFFKNGRIIFELYNEPTASMSSLKTWMQNTVNTIRANGANNLVLVAGTDYTYDIREYENAPITGGAIAYVTHPYKFKPDGDPLNQTANFALPYLNMAKKYPVVATEFGDANVTGFRSIPATQCEAPVYSSYIDVFEKANMNWTSWAWIVDEWGCGFPQLIADYSGAPNTIGTPVRAALMSH